MLGKPRSGDESGTCWQDLRAVGNSRRAHKDVLSVSWQQVPDSSPGSEFIRG